MSMRVIEPDMVDGFCTACKREVLVGPSLQCPHCGDEVDPLSLPVVPEAAKTVAASKPTTGRAAVLPRIKAALNLDSALDAALTALEAEEAAARTAYEDAKERYRLARQAAADMRQVRGLVRVSGDAAPKVKAKPVAPPVSADGSVRWSRNHDACVSCARTTVKHMARGLCSTCYAAQSKGSAS